MSNKVYNTLFICNYNAARSIMAEVLLNTMGHGRFKAYSAASMPANEVHPFTLQKLKHLGYDVTALRSKSWDEFAGPNAPEMDFIITLCDDAAGETCPIWPGHPMTAHWGFEDPCAATGTDEHKHAVFDKVYRQISSRISLFANMPVEKHDKVAIHHELTAISNHSVDGV